MKLINKTETTLIFSDINLVLMYDKNGRGIDIDDCDIKNSPTLKHYIEKGLVEIENPNDDNIVYRSIKNKQSVIDRQESKAVSKTASKVKAKHSSSSDIILGGQSEVITSRVNKISQTSSINKFRETGKMDISYSGPCFSPKTIVITSDGVKYIKDVSVFDRVITHTGKWKNVESIYKKEYNASLLNVRPTLSSGTSVKCTPKHKFYVNFEDEYSWKKACSLSNKDFLVCPNMEFEKGKEFLLISDDIEIDEDEKNEGFPSAVKISEGLLKIIYEYINFGFIEGDCKVSFRIDKEFFMEFVGLMREIFSVKSVKYIEHKSHFLYSCNSLSLVSFLQHYCGKENIKIPSFIFKKPLAKRFLRIILNSKEANKNGTIAIYSKNELVAWGIRLLLSESSVVSSIQYSPLRKNYCVSFLLKRHEELLKHSSILSKSFKWNSSSRKNRSATYILTEDAILLPVSDIEEGYYEQYVYNLEVEDDNSYTADFCAVHNCYDAGGYAKMNRNYMFGLNSKEDVNIKLDIPKDISLRMQVEDELISGLDNLRKNTVDEDCVKIFGQTASTILWGGYKILYTMMETEKVHPQYIDKCNSANEVWLPTDWCIEKFKEGGLKTKIFKMPIGVDLNNYSEGMKPVTFGGKESGFVFLSVFGWSLRKGYDILLQAYFEEFTKDDDVSLVICSRFAGKTDPTSKKVVMDEIKRIENSVKKTNKPKSPLLVSDVIPEKMMGNIYNSAHAYVCISRGEGFGLPYCEASVCGLPIISSNYSGQKDFLSHDNAYLVEPEGVAVNPGTEWVSYYYQGMPMANFGREAIEQTKAHMRFIYENYAIAKEKNKKLQKFIKENFNWDICIDRMHNRLKTIYTDVKHRGEK